MSVKLAPTDRYVRSVRVGYRIKHKDLDGALADAEDAVKLWPQLPGAYSLRAGVRRERKEYDKALADIDLALAMSPRSAELLNDRCWIGYLSGHDLERALADCDAALVIQPAFAGALDSRGNVLMRLGRLDDAIAAFDLALKQSPQQWRTLYARGVAKLRKGDKAGGDADIAAAKAGDPTVAEVAKRDGIAPQPAH